jgi:hypothetical protein
MMCLDYSLDHDMIGESRPGGQRRHHNTYIHSDVIEDQAGSKHLRTFIGLRAIAATRCGDSTLAACLAALASLLDNFIASRQLLMHQPKPSLLNT